MKLQNYRADYQRAVHRLAERIIAIGDESVPFADEAAVPMAHSGLRFAAECLRPGQRAADRGRPAADRGAGARHLDAAARPGADYYGATPHTWSPYRPDYPQPVADYAQELAKKCLDCKPLVGAFEDDMANWSSNGRPVPPSLCLVDAWVGLSAKHQEQLAGWTRSTSPGSACWSRGTARTRECMRHKTICARICGSTWGASWPACRGAARWPRTGSPRCRISASSCPR